MPACLLLTARALQEAGEACVTTHEHRLLVALAWMCQQYLYDHRGKCLDHVCMSAGERAIELLYEYGLVDSVDRGAQWTEAGNDFLDSN